MAWFKKDKKKDEPKEEQTAAPALVAPQTGDTRSYRAVRGPHVTEKASNMIGMGKYVFRITPRATKIDIRRSIEKLYKVNVTNVHIVRMPSKTRQVGRYRGTRSGYRKAIVTLRSGQTIDIN